TQVASIPFLLMIAVPPWLWLVGTAMFFRSALMNMSSPVAASFSMEIMEPHLRGTTSSLMRIADSLARALSSVCAGWIMARWGYDLPYVLTAALYMAASLIYYRQFQHFDAGRPGTHPSVRRPPGWAEAPRASPPGGSARARRPGRGPACTRASAGVNGLRKCHPN
ncbi:MAG: MFS transporter, partial [Bacillota bacterium]